MNNQTKEFSRRNLFSNIWRDAVRLMAEKVDSYSQSDSQLLLRPPFALPEKVFLATCTRCGNCINVCPQNILMAAGVKSGIALGTPTIAFKNNYCKMCFSCAEKCSSGALEIEITDCGKIGKAIIDDKACLAHKGSICNNCYYSCLRYKRAIKIERGIIPVIDTVLCDGCGRCVSSCLISNGVRIIPG